MVKSKLECLEMHAWMLNPPDLVFIKVRIIVNFREREAITYDVMVPRRASWVLDKMLFLKLSVSLSYTFVVLCTSISFYNIKIYFKTFWIWLTLHPISPTDYKTLEGIYKATTWRLWEVKDRRQTKKSKLKEKSIKQWDLVWHFFLCAGQGGYFCFILFWISPIYLALNARQHESWSWEVGADRKSSKKMSFFLVRGPWRKALQDRVWG